MLRINRKSPMGGKFTVLKLSVLENGVTMGVFNVHFSYNAHAKGSLGIFLAMVALCGLITVTATHYNSKSDKILRYFETSNPCIFLDHYPATAVGIVLWILMMFPTTGFDFTMIMHLYVRGDFSMIMYGCVMIFLSQALFYNVINVFSTNLYPDTYREGHETGPILPEELGTLQLHGLFYAAWLCGEIFWMVFMVRMWKLVTDTRMTKAQVFPWWMYLLFAFLCVGLCFAALLMLAVVMYGGGWNDPENESKWTYIMYVVINVNNTLRMSLWGWFPPFVARFLLGTDTGVTLQLHSDNMSALSVPQSSIVKYVGSFSPERLSGGATRLMVLCTIFIYFFTNPVKTEEINLPLASGFRTDPFVYFFAPVWLLYIVLHTSGLYTACAREAMNPSFTTGPCELSCLAPLKKYRLKALQGVGITWSLSCAVLLLVIQHRFNHVDYVAIVYAVCVGLWVLLLEGINRKSLLYVIVWTGLSCAAPYHDFAAFWSLVILSMFEYLLPEADLHIVAELVGFKEDDISKRPVKPVASDDEPAAASGKGLELDVILTSPEKQQKQVKTSSQDPAPSSSPSTAKESSDQTELLSQSKVDSD